MTESKGNWQRRWHPLRQEWVTITSHRNQRPWSGSAVSLTETPQQQYDPSCYLCPGNTRVSGKTNDQYTDLFVFDNDHPSYGLNAPKSNLDAPGIYKAEAAKGITRVMCYSANHQLSLAELSHDAITAVLQRWADETKALHQNAEVEHVMIFENKGEVVGVSNPHPHCQIYATGFVAKHIELEQTSAAAYFSEHQSSLFQAIIQTEIDDGRRLLTQTKSSVAFIPYFCRLPYESYVMPKQQVEFLYQLDTSALADLAMALKTVLVAYDNMWQMSFPYVLTVHQAPKCGDKNYHCHIQIHPLLRQPGLQKYIAGAELGGGTFLNDVDPEAAAEVLRNVPEEHYLRAQIEI